MPSLQVQSLPVYNLTLPSLPAIRFQSASPHYISPPSGLLRTSLGNIKAVNSLPRPAHSPGVKDSRIQRRKGLRKNIRKPTALPGHMVKEAKQSKNLKGKKQQRQHQEKHQDTTKPEMSPRSPRMSSASSKPSSPGTTSPSNAKRVTKATVKDTDWADVTDPEERRRIQNRIAQRKFREKAKENKDKAEREMRNQENAGNSYRIPTADDFLNDTELSGLPWGSISFGHVVSRGHETEGQRSSGRGTFVGDEGSGYQTASGGGRPFGIPSYTTGFPPQAPSYGSSGPEDAYMEDTAASYYSPVLQGFNPLTPQ